MQKLLDAHMKWFFFLSNNSAKQNFPHWNHMTWRTQSKSPWQRWSGHGDPSPRFNGMNLTRWETHLHNILNRVLSLFFFWSAHFSTSRLRERKPCQFSSSWMFWDSFRTFWWNLATLPLCDDILWNRVTCEAAPDVLLDRSLSRCAAAYRLHYWENSLDQEVMSNRIECHYYSFFFNR